MTQHRRAGAASAARGATTVSLAPSARAAVRSAFEARVQRGPGSHWFWAGHFDVHGWARLHALGRAWGASHVAWWLAGRTLVAGTHLWRTCSQERCIAPHHRTTQPPAWSAKRRAAEERRKSAKH